MVLKVGRNVNSNNVAVHTEVELNSSTAVKIADEDSDRIVFSVNNDNSAIGYWVRLYPASQDNEKRGIFLTPKTGNRSFWQMPTDNIYTGEISAIAENGSPKAYTTEY